MAQRLDIRMPVLSDTMEAGELIEWNVAPGASVREGQALASVATDKVDMELESPYEGVIAELLAEPGETVPVGSVVATVETEQSELLAGLDFAGGQEADDGAAASTPEVAPAGGDGAGGDGASGEAAGGDGRAGGIVPAAPPARRRAREHGVDLADVPATGRRGQVTPEDVERYVAERRAAPVGADGAATGAAEGGAPAAEPGAVRSPAARGAPAGDRRLRLRRATAQRMSRSAQIPQFTLHRRVDLERAARLRGGRSWTTEFARALAAALWRHPELNAVWDDKREQPAPLEQVRIGLAVDSPDGLVVVGVDDPDAVQPEEADRRVREAAARGQRGELHPDDAAGLSSTVSNLGGFGVDRFTALLMPPQATILSVGRIAEAPVVTDGRLRPRLTVELGLTVDHRVADGADAARLLETLADRLEG